MVDMSVIAGTLNSLRVATEIAKFLKESNLSLKDAESKLKLAELVNAIAETKIQFAKVQQTLIEKEKRIRELEEAFEAKGELVRYRDAYFSVNSEGKPAGVAYCLSCWENYHKRRQLVTHADSWQIRVCTSCGRQYKKRSTSDLPETGQQETEYLRTT